MALSLAKKSLKEVFEKKTVLFWPFFSPFFVGLKYFLGLGLLALEKYECFDDKSYSSLLNFYDSIRVSECVGTWEPGSEAQQH